MFMYARKRIKFIVTDKLSWKATVITKEVEWLKGNLLFGENWKGTQGQEPIHERFCLVKILIYVCEKEPQLGKPQIYHMWEGNHIRRCSLGAQLEKKRRRPMKLLFGAWNYIIIWHPNLVALSMALFSEAQKVPEYKEYGGLCQSSRKLLRPSRV